MKPLCACGRCKNCYQREYDARKRAGKKRVHRASFGQRAGTGNSEAMAAMRIEDWFAGQHAKMRARCAEVKGNVAEESEP